MAGATRADFAAAAVAALLDESTGQTVYELGGTPFTMEDLAAAVTEVTGTAVGMAEVSPDQFPGILEGAGLPVDMAAMYRGFEESTARAVLNTEEDTDLADLLGRDPVSLVDAVRASV